MPPSKKVVSIKRSRKRDSGNFKNFIHIVFQKQAESHEDWQKPVRIRKRTMTMLNSINIHVFEKIYKEVCFLAYVSKRKTISFRDVETAVRFVFTAKLANYANEFARKAMKNFINYPKQISRTLNSSKAGLDFPGGKTRSLMKKTSVHQRISLNASIYMTAVLQYVMEEIGEKAIDALLANQLKYKSIAPRILFLGIRKDEELSDLINGIFSQSGSVPSIEHELLPVKRPESRKPQSIKVESRKRKISVDFSHKKKPRTQTTTKKESENDKKRIREENERKFKLQELIELERKSMEKERVETLRRLRNESKIAVELKAVEQKIENIRPKNSILRIVVENSDDEDEPPRFGNESNRTNSSVEHSSSREPKTSSSSHKKKSHVKPSTQPERKSNRTSTKVDSLKIKKKEVATKRNLRSSSGKKQRK